MNVEELNKLLDKYYNGESTAEEENILREFFNGEHVPDGYEAEKEIFGYYHAVSGIPDPSEDFESRILAGIDEAEKKGKSNPLRINYMPLLGAAASILLLAGSYFYYTRNLELKDTYSDPKIAYAETRKILLDVSLKMNRAERKLEPVSKMNKMTTKSFEAINRSTLLVEENLKSLDMLVRE